MASVFCQGMTMKFLPHVGTHKEVQIRKIFDISDLICKLQTKIPKIPIFGNAISRHANFTNFCRIVHIDVRNKSWKFHIEISKINYFTEQSVKWGKNLVCKIQNGLWNAHNVTWHHQIYWVMSCHPYLDTDQVSSLFNG